MTDQQPIQPVAALAQMMAEMAAMHREQAVTNQQNLQQLHLQTARQTQVLEGLLFRSEASLRGVTLHPMTASDDPQVFVDMFRATAEACGWPEAEWAVRLLPLLMGEARAAALALPAAARAEFPEVRRAVLDRTGEDHRRRFRGLRLGPAIYIRPPAPGCSGPVDAPGGVGGGEAHVEFDGVGAVYGGAPDTGFILGPVPPARNGG